MKETTTDLIPTENTDDKDNKETLDFYTYHRGRVGEEPRNEKTGELLYDVDVLDTNHYWDPNLNISIRVRVPLTDPKPPPSLDKKNL